MVLRAYYFAEISIYYFKQLKQHKNYFIKYLLPE